ncbi:hypothetical protein BGW38_000624 [Lunasporangiospora selenospora]|uniref:Protein kinase domain-containing protein n=1 Tax=Lunasporangiospora selenospora TaxID=979761 RepID=A0A9P6KE22_9FUNG|nr:hypothetical protein BGW38_000624 [Lunasporangiospora selenospora]
MTVTMLEDAETQGMKDQVFLKNLSTTGTVVNQDTITADTQIELHDKDEIRFHNNTINTPESFANTYTIGKLLGSGKNANVYRATDKDTKVVYAGKVVMKDPRFTPKVAINLDREIAILMTINHVMSLYRVFNEERSYVLVTELAPYGELFDLIVEKERFTESEARHIFRQLLSGVQYLHARGIVHRDLKAENILVMDNQSLTVKISDFGLATFMGDRGYLETVCGTPQYLAPEILRREEYGKAVDMWSLGVILYISLCGFPPFSEDLGPPSMRIQVLSGKFEFFAPFWEDIGESAKSLVSSLLMLNPAERLSVDEALEHPWFNTQDLLPPSVSGGDEANTSVRGWVLRLRAERRLKGEYRKKRTWERLHRSLTGPSLPSPGSRLTRTGTVTGAGTSGTI